MSKSTLLVTTSDANSITYANPARPAQTVRFKTSRTAKKVGVKQTFNTVSEVIINDGYVHADGSTEVISLRIKRSGSAEAQARLDQLEKDYVAMVDALQTNKVHVGFRPTTTLQMEN